MSRTRRTLPCAVPGCRNRLVPGPLVCSECRDGSEREAPRSACERTDAGRGSLPRSPRRSGSRQTLIDVCLRLLEDYDIASDPVGIDVERGFDELALLLGVTRVKS